jgi:fucose 4-O-acetylase-like acetyltransferase
LTNKKWIDVAKGIGAIIVIFLHSGFSETYLKIGASFVLALFFLIAGYLFNYEKYKTNPEYFIQNKFKRLVVPYFITNIIILCTYALLSFFKIYQVYNEIEFSSIRALIGVFYGNGAPLNPSTIFTNTLNIPSWFLLCLFCSSLLLYILTYSHKKYGLYISSLISFLIILFGFEISKYIFLPWSFDISCVSIVFMFPGYLIRYYERNWFSKSFKNIYFSFASILLFFTVTLNNGLINMNQREYFNFAFFIFEGFLGTYITIKLAKEISSTESLLTKFFVFLGNNSLIIVLYHTFTPDFFINALNIFINIKETVYSIPILNFLNMLIFSIVTIIIIKRLPLLSKIY